MALPWFKVATNVVNHPKMFDLAARLPRADPVGVVLRLWCWSASFFPDGEIPAKAEPALTAAVTGYVTGASGSDVVTALIESGWLDRGRKGLVVHDWDVEQGEHVNMQERNRAKQQAFRDRNRLRNRNALPGVTGSEERRGEERREEEIKDQKPPAAEKPAAPVRKRPVASPEEQACRKALRDAFEQAFTQHSQGKVYLWNAADQTGIKTICNAVGNQAPAALEILAEYKRRMASDPFMAANLSPRFIASRLNVLRVPIVAPTPTRPATRDLRFGNVPAASLDQCKALPQGQNKM